jgi:hypothetical protein
VIYQRALELEMSSQGIAFFREHEMPVYYKNNQMKLFSAVPNIIPAARQLAYCTSNNILLNMYWQIGHLIVEEEQGGKQKAAYRKTLLKQLSYQLALEFGKGFDERNLNNMRTFYLAFEIWNAVRTELSLTHYRMISHIEYTVFRTQYMMHSIESNWDTRTLKRNINTQYLNRALELPNEQISQAQFVKTLIFLNF